jgi:hypothetical protein
MFEEIRTWIRRSPLVTYFTLAFTISWTIELVLVANHYGLLQAPGWIHYFAAFGPGLSGALIAFLADGRLGVDEAIPFSQGSQRHYSGFSNRLRIVATQGRANDLQVQ